MTTAVRFDTVGVMARSTTRLAVVLLTLGVLLGAAACRFDPGGLGGGAGDDDDDDDDDDSARDSGSSIDAAPDAPPADASPCADEDGDLVPRVNVEGAACGEVLDCDDTDEDAFPGQPGFFDHARVSGGFDYDCDGAEEPFTEIQGEECHFDWFTCVGTGWLDSVPACGELGKWHVCVDGGIGSGCMETESVEIAQSCQ
jgi:hypothetical protein